MDAADFRDHLESAKATELDRLGSSKLLIALTDAQLDPRSVLETAADSENAAHNTFAAWAADETDEEARDAFEATATREADHRERVLEAMEGKYEPADGGPMHVYLRGREGTVERVAAGMVARSLVTLRTHTQIISFFVNEADRSRADLFRDLKDETEDTLEQGLSLLEQRCERDEDWDDARAVGEYLIQVAYDDYEDALTELGVDVKNVC